MLELIRGRCGNVYGDLFALMTILKGLPIGYNRDLQEDKRLTHHKTAAHTLVAKPAVKAAAVKILERSEALHSQYDALPRLRHGEQLPDDGRGDCEQRELRQETD